MNASGVWRIKIRRPHRAGATAMEILEVIEHDGFLELTDSGALLLRERKGTEGDARYQKGPFKAAIGASAWITIDLESSTAEDGGG